MRINVPSLLNVNIQVDLFAGVGERAFANSGCQVPFLLRKFYRVGACVGVPAQLL
jgi:hypothetical protein